MTKTYESVILLNDKLTEKEFNSIVDKLEDHLIRTTIKTFKTEKFGKRKLAYEIKTHKEAWYVMFTFRASPGYIPEWEEMLRANDQVIKFISILVDEKDEEDDLESIPDESEQNLATADLKEEETVAKEIDAFDLIFGYIPIDKDLTFNESHDIISIKKGGSQYV